MIDIKNPPGCIELGKTGENDFRTVSFDVAEWLAAYPSAQISVTFARPDHIVYPVVLNATANPVVWTVSAQDVQVAGEGSVEVYMTRDGVVGKSVTMRTMTFAGLEATMDALPTTDTTWLDSMLSAAARAERACEAAETAADNAQLNTALAAVAKTGSYNDLANKPVIPALADNLTETVAGKALDATQGKLLADSIATLEAGGMTKAAYDADGDGVVDAAANAAKLGGNLPAYYLAAAGDGSDTTVRFETAQQRAALTTGEKLSSLFGKIGRFLSDLHIVAFSGSYNDLTDKPQGGSLGTHAASHATGGSDPMTPASIGAGDMSKAIYDADFDGVVDNAQRLGGQLPAYYAADAQVYHKIDGGQGNLPVFGGDGALADSAVPAPLAADTAYYIAVTGSDTTGNGSEAAPWATMTHALARIPKNLGGYTATLHIADGSYGACVVNGFVSGGLELCGVGTDAVLTRLSVTNCSCSVKVDALKLTWLVIHAVQYCWVHGCTISAGTASGNFAIDVSGSFCNVDGTTINNSFVAVNVSLGAVVVAQSTAGSGNTRGYVADTVGGIIQIGPACNMAASTLYRSANGGRVYKDAQPNTGISVSAATSSIAALLTQKFF